MEARQLLAADLPYGVTPLDTGEVLLGSVTVTPVFFESDGSIDADTEQWTDEQVDRTLDKIRESVDWWKQLLATRTSVHTLDFVIDETYARQRVSTGYEPITRHSHDFQLYAGEFLTDLGYADASSFERAVNQFNDAQRRIHQTDWAFTFFVVDSSDDDDGFFPSGFNGAFAYPGGLFIVVPSERPVSTYTHEMGHIFWALDEYSGGDWEETRGYYNSPNWNAPNNTTPGFVQQDSIMRGGAVAVRAYDNLFTPDETLELVGWRDSDGDGIFDIADVPLILSAVGSYDLDRGVYTIRGSAAVDTLANENSAGTQSDLTFNRVSELQYKLDDGDWQTALSIDNVQADFEVEVSIPTPFDSIHWRAIDTDIGVTSPILTGDALTPVFSGVGGGFAYLDQNRNGARESDDPLLEGTQFTVRRGDGSDLFHQGVDAGTLPEGIVVPPPGMLLVASGDEVDGSVAAMASTTDATAGQVFQTYDTRRDRWRDTWGGDRQLQLTTPESTGRVEIDFIATDTGGYGVENGSYARVEVFDDLGNRIDRVTSELVLAGEHQTLVVEDSLGRISRVLIYGHAETEILVRSVQFGRPEIVSTLDGGAFSVDGLPDGDYSVELVPTNLIYQFPAEPVTFAISGGAVSPIAIAAERVDSPRHNATEPADANGDDTVSVRDALVVINDLGRFGSRTLTADEIDGFNVDVNNDGQVSAIDALLIINLLGRQAHGEAEQVSENSSQTDPLSAPINTTDPVASSQTLQPLSSGAVDDVFGRENPYDPSNPSDPFGPQLHPMWNFEGQPTSGQSPNAAAPDSSSLAGVHQTDETGAKAGLERHSLEFSLSDGQIRLALDAEA